MSWLHATLGLASAGALGTAITQLRINSLREQRLARAMHELRNPIHTAMLVADRSGEPVRKSVALHLRRCALALEQFESQRQGLAVVESISADRRFDLGDAAEDVVEAWPGAQRIRLDRAAGSLTICGDRRLLEQSLANVIANALEHGEGRVTVSTDRSDGRALVVVRDQGPGFASERGQRRFRAARGTRGHGLAIAATAVGMLGGRLVTARANEDGAGVVIDLPLAVEISVSPRGAALATARPDAR